MARFDSARFHNPFTPGGWEGFFYARNHSQEEKKMHKGKPWLRFAEGVGDQGNGGAPAGNPTGGNQPEGGAGETQGAAGGSGTDGTGGDDGGNPQMSVEDYKKELEKVRREAAKYRTERNELRPLADKAREVEEANKTELQKAQEALAQRDAELTKVKQDSLRAAVAAATGVPAKFIHGDTEEQMTEYATELQESMASKQDGKRGLVVDAVGRQSDPPSDKDEWVKNFFGR